MALLLGAALLLAAYIVFRKIVRREYFARGHLSWPSSLLQLLIFMGFFCLPYLYSPPEWALFWEFGDGPTWNAIVGFALIICGFLLAFGTMFWFGIRRAFGRPIADLIQTGPYRWSRNPQVLGGYLLVIGTSLEQPSLYALGWVMLYGCIAQMMIVTEEEHLRRQFGEAFDRYCARVTRYLRLGFRPRVFPNN